MVEKAIELFKERGTEAVSIKDICDRAAVTRNAFYYHFESKDLLFDSVGDWVSRISKERIQMIYEPDSYYQQFWEYYRAYILTEIEMGADIMNRICFSRTMKGRADYYSYIDDKLALQMTALIRRAQEEKIVRNSGNRPKICCGQAMILFAVSISSGVSNGARLIFSARLNAALIHCLCHLKDTLLNEHSLIL